MKKDSLLHLIKECFRKLGLLIRKISPSSDSGCLISTILRNQNITFVLDVGANTGQFGKEIRINGYNGNILSFEPLSDAYKILRERTATDENWSVYERCAVGKANALGNINVSANSVSSSFLDMNETHLTAAPASEFIRTEEVKILKLSSIITELNLSDENVFLKIDTQGTELDIIHDLSDLIRRFNVIMVEGSLVPLYNDQHTWLEVKAAIEKQNFILWSLISGFTDNSNGRSLQVDMVFLNKSRIDGYL